MKMTAALALGAALIAAPALAQDQAGTAAPAAAEPAAAPAPPPMTYAPPAPPAPMVLPAAAKLQLPAESIVILAMSHELHSSRHDQGDVFPLTVAQDVKVGDAIVIPRGTRGVGEITWRTGKGVFGKSAKMEIALRYLELDGKRLPVEGRHRQEGEGNTAVTIGAVAAAGVIGGLVITGRSAIISQGREFSVRTAEAIPFLTDGSPTARLDPAFVPAAVRSGPLEVNVTAQSEQETCEEYGRRRAPQHAGTAYKYEKQCQRERDAAERT